MSARDGDVVHGYRLFERLGRGGMGAVFRAVDEDGVEVALKLLDAVREDDAAARRRFAAEAAVLLALDHPRIVRARSGLLGAEGDQPCFAMELVRGSDLRRVLERRGHLPAREALAIVDDVLEALIHAHGRGVLHRDVKPANVFVDADGRARLGDFGLAHALGATRLTGTGSVLGTPEYMSPEQADGRELDARCDVYAVGVLLFECLAGHPPFQSAQPLAVLRMHVERLAPPLPANVDRALASAVGRALAKAPEERFADAAAMRAALEVVRERLLAGGDPIDDVAALVAADTAELGVPRTPVREVATTGSRARPRGGRAGLVLGVVSVVGVLAWSARRDPEPPLVRDEAPLAVDTSAPTTTTVTETPAVADTSPAVSATVAAVETSAVEPYVVRLRDGTSVEAARVSVDGTTEEVVALLEGGVERRLPFAAVASWERASPRAAGRPVAVTLRSGGQFRASLVSVDLTRGELVTRSSDGVERRDPLDGVVAYEVDHPDALGVDRPDDGERPR